MKRIAVIAVFLFVIAGAYAQQKYALVIGNANYTNFGSLRNTLNDADDMEAVLEGMGWTVEKILNGSLDRMENAVTRLKNRLLGSRDSYGFFYYSGHGVQSNGDNYLIPADANISSENYLRQRAMSVQTMLDELNDAGNALNLIILDACRNFPAGWTKSSNKGMAVLSPPADSVIMYATSAGSTASDGEGRNGLFTAHLLNNLRIPGLEVGELIRRTGADVIRASGGTQRPAVYNQFFGAAYLGSRPDGSPAPQAVPAGLRWVAKGSGVVITKYSGDASVLNIPDQIQGLPVTAIGERAFSGCSKMTSISIPSSVTSIGESAFSYCGGLTSVIIPSSITSIGKEAFSSCYNLTSVTIPASVASIGEGAFNWCGLTVIMVDPRNTAYTSIDGVLFDKAGKTLVEYPAGRTGAYSIPAGVTSIGEKAFFTCKGLTSVAIPSSVISIGDSAFSSCGGLTSVTIPASVISIGDSAFNVCEGLMSVTIPSSVTSIGKEAFNCSGLTSVTIPASVASIGNSAFAFCTGLTVIMVDPRNTAYTSIDGVLFDKAGKTLVEYPAGKTGAYVIPTGVASIGEEAFNGCKNLTSVTIPASVAAIGKEAFNVCEGLMSVTIPSGITSIGDMAFWGCVSLVNITIPPSVISIGLYTFSSCGNLTSVTLSRRTQVGYEAFPEGVQIRYSD